MKLSDYIVQWLSDKGIRDFYGYQGTMIAHFVDSISKNVNVKNHSCYNEQGAAFAACITSSSVASSLLYLMLSFTVPPNSHVS